MERPNMRSEIIEAIKNYYHDDIEIMVDCLRYLQEDNEVEEMGYCPFCGNKMIVYPYREYHAEVDAWENLYEVCCPNCDFT